MRENRTTMRIAIGSDDVGLPLKDVLAGYLSELGIEYED
jgi:ribose 5-phosphate isomerase RpiB